MSQIVSTTSVRNNHRTSPQKKSFLRRLFDNPERCALDEFGRLKNEVNVFSELLAVAREMFANADSVSVYAFEDNKLYPVKFEPFDKPQDKYEHELLAHVVQTRSSLFSHRNKFAAFNLTPFDRSYRCFDGQAKDDTKDRILIPLTESNDTGSKIIGVLAISGDDLSLKNSIFRVPTRSMTVASSIASSIVFSTKYNRDFATFLPTKREFEEDLCDFLAADIPFSMVLIDIDDFKRVNTEYGHFAADQALSDVAEILKCNSRKSVVSTSTGDRRVSRPPPPPTSSDVLPSEHEDWDTKSPPSVAGIDKVYRWGGDEFIVLLAGVDRHTATHIIERSRQKIANHKVRFHRKVFSVTITAAIVDNEIITTNLKDDQKPVDVAKELAEQVHRRGKIEGKNRTAVY